MKLRRRAAQAALIVAGAAIVLVELITVEPVNPPSFADSQLKAPAQIARDVASGRKELNFSEWRSYYPQTRKRKLQWMGRVLRDRSMPPRVYRVMHPSARLTDAERGRLERWIESGISASIPPNSITSRISND